jgi:hypothetical protein
MPKPQTQADINDWYDQRSNGEAAPEPEPKSTAAPWPDPLGEAAYHGVTGKLVRLLEPVSEADSAALLLQTLIGWGSLAGRGPHMLVEADRHYTNEYVVVVGTTSKARKGTSWGRVLSILGATDEHWADHRLIHGLGSGEALIDAVAENDHRALILEGEFARLLAVINREGTTLSHVLRNGWDHGRLEVKVRKQQAAVRGAHVSLIGHITRDELLRRLSDVEIANGFGNRMLWVCARRSKQLPRGGGTTDDATDVLCKLRNATDHARRMGDARVDFGDAAGQLWDRVYGDLSEGQPGLLGSATNRAEAHVLRLSLIYALLDCSAQIGLAHLEAALEVWRYCYASARYIWGTALGDPTADAIIAALDNNPDGLTRCQLSNHFRRNKPASEMDRALNLLIERGRIRFEREETSGRTSTRYWIA